jgi:hypothetical protein
MVVEEGMVDTRVVVVDTQLVDGVVITEAQVKQDQVGIREIMV